MHFNLLVFVVFFIILSLFEKLAKMQRTSTRKRKSPDFLSSTACNSTTKENPPQKSKHNAPVSVVKDTEEPHFDSTLVPTRNSKDELVFLDYPEFRPNLTPEEVLRRGMLT